jgi:hypothetical protein
MHESSLERRSRPSIDPLVTLGDRVRRVAAEDGIAFSFQDSVWIATDTATGERASDVSMAGAWAGVRDVDVFTVHRWLDERNASVVRPPEWLGDP